MKQDPDLARAQEAAARRLKDDLLAMTFQTAGGQFRTAYLEPHEAEAIVAAAVRRLVNRE
jgi:hypothetical protein